MNANHGGGYSYRLCKIPEEGRSGLTEVCFQRTPLFFASNEQWVQTGYDTETRIYFTANRTTKGTYPPGKKIRLITTFSDKGNRTHTSARMFTMTTITVLRVTVIENTRNQALRAWF
jgi:hypothetical protein